MSALGRVLAALAVLLAAGVSTAGEDPLAGVVLVDLTDRSWALDELRGEPVLVVIADRSASAQAEEWGRRLATAPTDRLAPWRAPGKVAWLSIADLGRVPEYARAAARERLRAPDAARPPGAAGRSSPLLLDWSGGIGERFAVVRGSAVVVLLARDHQPIVRRAGPPTGPAVTEIVAALAGAASP